MRLRYRIEVSISSTYNEERDLGNTRWEVVTDQQTEGGVWKATLANGSTNVPLPLDTIADATFVAIRINPTDPNDTANAITIAINSTMSTPITIAPISQESQTGHFLLSTTGLTALYASNSGSVSMDITLVAVGNAS